MISKLSIIIVLRCFCSELGRLATEPTPPPVPPPVPIRYAVAPDTSSEAMMARGGRQDAGIPRAARWRIGGSRGVAAPYPKARLRGRARAAAGLPPPKLARPSAPRLGAVSWEQTPRELLGAFRILSP